MNGCMSGAVMLCRVKLVQHRKRVLERRCHRSYQFQQRPEQYCHARPSMHHWMHPDGRNTSNNFQTNNTHCPPHIRTSSCMNPIYSSRRCTFVGLSRWWSVLDRNNMLRPHYYTTVAMWMVRVPTNPLIKNNDECERLGVLTNDLPNLSRSVNQNMPPTHWLIVVRCPSRIQLSIHIVLE